MMGTVGSLFHGQLDPLPVAAYRLRAAGNGRRTDVLLGAPCNHEVSLCPVLSWVPDVAGEIVEQIRECPADRVVRWAAGALTSMYVITGLAWVIWNVQMDRLPVNCFREAFLAKVAAYQQCGDEMSASGTDAPAAHTELRVDGK